MKMIKFNEPKYAVDEDRFYFGSKLLRKLHADELPQLINIIKGDMSFVGPRPEQIEFFNQLKSKYPTYQNRVLVKPGLTGLAQIEYKYAANDDEQLTKLSYDLYYVLYRSLFLDFKIVLKTIYKIFFD